MRMDRVGETEILVYPTSKCAAINEIESFRYHGIGNGADRDKFGKIVNEDRYG